MRKFWYIILLLINISLLSSCSSVGAITERLDLGSEEKQADARMQQLIEAIQEQDKDGLKSLFSQKALSEAEDIDMEIDYLFDLIKGEIKSFENDKWSSGESIDYGKRSLLIRSWYNVTTDTNEYIFFLLDYSIDTINPDNAGLYTLRVVNAEDEETQLTYWQDMEIAGIYKPAE